LTEDDAHPSVYGPWNPGIDAQVPKEILHLSTIFRSENVFTSVTSALELNGLTGFPLSELVAFRPERLALHELLIRVTADFSVPDGSRIGDLGINFREIARRLLAAYVIPEMPACSAAYEEARRAVRDAVECALAAVMPVYAPQDVVAEPVRSPVSRFWRRIAGSRGVVRERRTDPPAADRRWGPAEIARVAEMAAQAETPLQAMVCRTLGRVMSALFTTHGHAWGTRELIVSLTTDIAANAWGSMAIGRVLDPLLRNAAEREGYRLLPRQERPVVINTKGASASGKSSLRPMQKKLAGDIGAAWEDFALISPDIWRKQLLDYDSLGASFKYAGAFTAEEVQIIDHKLDRYMARKNRRGDMSHLLIDRFRFDSFAPDSDQAGSNLLTRFGQTVYLFFMITPPDLLVERAWNRGLEFGRYKAVDDTLSHAVEAYSGIPNVFFTWVQRADKRICFEFLDNTVPIGERPRTAAFGDNTTFNILDVGKILDIERSARIDVHATTPGGLHPNPRLLEARDNTGFLQRCVARFSRVNFVEQSTGRVYLRIESGVVVWKDAPILAAVLADPDAHAGVLAVATEAQLAAAPQGGGACGLAESASGRQTVTLGQWGGNPAP
jgi:hypothetical protein